MKRVNIISAIVCLSVAFFLVSCSLEEETADPESITSTITTTDNSVLLEEIDKFKIANEKLTYENDSLKGRIEYLEKSNEQSSIILLHSNYYIDELLEKIYTENSKVDIFPGVLQSIRIETTDEAIYFVFSIDRMAVNPNWDGPGSDGGRGYFINSEEKYQDYKGRLDTVFAGIEHKGYETYQEKQETILADYGNKINYVYNFYMIGDEIVFVGHDPGP